MIGDGWHESDGDSCKFQFKILTKWTVDSESKYLSGTKA
jgi:hypothetical protein